MNPFYVAVGPLHFACLLFFHNFALIIDFKASKPSPAHLVRMDCNRLDSLSKYFVEKERKKLNNLVKNSSDGIPTMTALEIKQSCVENNGYETPELNDKLYLHFRGYRKIENLDEYSGCKALWLDSNGFDKIEGLCKLSELRCLYLGKNLISTIEGLDSLVNLHTIDLSYNRISIIKNLSCCIALKTLIITRNNLSTAESIAHLVECQSIECLDLTNNTLEGQDTMNVLAQMPSLVTLSITGNDVTKLPSFRKRTIASMPRLGYLDRPIDELEKLGAIAYVSGGAEAESKARDDYRDEQQRRRVNEALLYRTWQAEQRELRKKEIAEGKTFYKEFTEEEKREREDAAAAAALEERRMLARGFDKLTNRYWDNPTSEIVPVSVEIVEEEDTEKAMCVVVEDEHGVFDATATAPAAAVPDQGHVDCSEIDLDLDDEEEPPVVDAIQVELENSMRRAREMEEAEQAQRDRLVADSLAMFKQQQAEKRDKQQHSAPVTEKENASTTTVNTWEAALTAPVVHAPFRVTLQWSLQMDLKLAALVRECAFDFDKIFLKMISAASDGLLGDLPKAALALISSEACRLRWSELDATQWSVQAPDSTIQDVVYKVCVTPEDVSDGQGGQLSFDKLAVKASSAYPKYLVPPKVLPSVRAEEEDDDDDDEEVLDLRAIALQMKSRQ